LDLLNLLRKPGEEIRKERKRKGLTQSVLAKKAKVSQALIARIEKNQVDPRLSTLRKIVEALMEDTQPRGSRAIDIAVKDVIVVNDDDTIEKALKLMRKYGISQLPVLKNGTLVTREGRLEGIITKIDVLMRSKNIIASV